MNKTASEQDFRFIFVGGCSRSGTTLVQKILIAHSKVAGGGEFDHAERIMDLYQIMCHTQKKRHSEFYNTDELADVFRRFYKSAFFKIADRKESASYLSEKTPRNIFAAERLLRLFPDSWYVNIVRDGRDVVVSHLDVNRRRDRLHKQKFRRFKFGKTCALWNECISTFSRISGNLEIRDRVINLSYEELATNPGAVIPSLLERLGLDMEDHLLHPEEYSMQDYGIEADNIWYTKDMLDQSISTSKIGRWKRDMLPPTRWLCEILLAENLQRMGYSLKASSLWQQRGLLFIRNAFRALIRILYKFKPSNIVYKLRKKFG